MNATATVGTATRHDEPGKQFAQQIEEDFTEASDLLSVGHAEMALIRAVASFEWFMKRAFIEPYLRSGAVDPSGELADIIVAALLRNANGWDNEITALLRAFWGIETRTLPMWKDFKPIWKLRSRIVHDGGRCTDAQAREAIDTCEQLLKVLLVARIEATRLR